jgi:hypothetical protein
MTNQTTTLNVNFDLTALNVTQLLDLHWVLSRTGNEEGSGTVFHVLADRVGVSAAVSLVNQTDRRLQLAHA